MSYIPEYNGYTVGAHFRFNNYFKEKVEITFIGTRNKY